MDGIALATKLGGGKFLEDLHANVVRVAAEVMRTGKAGAVTIKLPISLPQQGEPLLIIDQEITTSLPKVKGKGSMVFMDDEGALHNKDPRQTEMDFTVLEGGNSGEVQKIEAQEAQVREVTE